jgi:hypothetical protein
LEGFPVKKNAIDFRPDMVNTYNHIAIIKGGKQTKNLTRFISTAALAFGFSDASANPKPQASGTETREDGSVPGLERTRSETGTTNHRRLASRLQMESRFRVLNQRLDSLLADSLLVPIPMRQQFLKALQTASRVRDSAKAHLFELRITEAESNSAKWASIRKKSQRSLDGLHRFFLDAESILQVDLENKEPAPSAKGGEVY